MYEKELKAINKSNRFRVRKLYAQDLYDFASNDYLGLAQKKQLLKRAYDRVNMFQTHAPKASQLVNGYHPIHKEFEECLCTHNGFESALVVGSGFLANLSLIEALPRKRDILLMDEEYHASGVVGSKLLDCEVVYFKHNDADALEELLKTKTYHRAIVAVEGIYSMSGDLLNVDIFQVVDKYEAILIVDEAHSSGIIGKNLLGIFDYFGIEPKPHYIKMGTLGKAFGSYGAYILSSKHISDFLQNRAKALIYATAPSIFDIALAHQGFLYMFKHKKELFCARQQREELVRKEFGFLMQGLIFPYEMSSSLAVIQAQELLEKEGFLVGAIRPPTVTKPILRIIPRLNLDIDVTQRLFKTLLGAVS
jgi:8-amino-7-oxononanoate synthase